MAKTHAAPLGWHVRKPETKVLSLSAQLDKFGDVGPTIIFGNPLGLESLFGRRNNIGDEGSNLPPQFLEFG
jgi:hypothetical protein